MQNQGLITINGFGVNVNEAARDDWTSFAYPPEDVSVKPIDDQPERGYVVIDDNNDNVTILESFEITEIHDWKENLLCQCNS